MFSSWLTCAQVAPLGFLCKCWSPLFVTTESLFLLPQILYLPPPPPLAYFFQAHLKEDLMEMGSLFEGGGGLI